MIVTKGYGGNALVTQGYGYGGAAEFVREVIRRASKLTKHLIDTISFSITNLFTSSIRKVSTANSLLYNNDINVTSSLKTFFIFNSLLNRNVRETATIEQRQSILQTRSSIPDEVSETSTLSRSTVLTSSLDRDPDKTSATSAPVIIKDSSIDLEEI